MLYHQNFVSYKSDDDDDDSDDSAVFIWYKGIYLICETKLGKLVV